MGQFGGLIATHICKACALPEVLAPLKSGVVAIVVSHAGNCLSCMFACSKDAGGSTDAGENVTLTGKSMYEMHYTHATGGSELKTHDKPPATM